MRKESEIEISIIIPVFNRQEYLGRCLRSLIHQSIERSKYEIIVVDDGSSDNTLDIAKAFGSEVRIFNHESNKGLPSALNTGIKNSNGLYILRVDSDDYVNFDFIKILHMFMINNDKNYDAFACDYLLVDDHENIIDTKSCEKYPIGCGIIFKKKHLIEIGSYNEKFLIDEDKELMSRFKKKFKTHRVALPLYRYKIHSSNLTKERDEKQEKI